MSRRGTGIRAAAPVALALAALLLAPAPALAHTDLVSSTPVEGALLEEAPAVVTLTFSEPVLADSAAVSVEDETGFVVRVLDLEVTDATLTLSWPPGLPGSEYAVNYRVVAQDGHPIEGTLTFAAAGAPAAQTTAPDVTAQSAAADVPAAAGPEPADSDSGPPLFALAGVWIGIVAVAIALVVTARRARRGGSGTS